MNKKIMQQALTALKSWDALIKYQYGGSSEAMTAMQNVAWQTLDTIEGLETALAQPEREWVGLTDKEIVDCWINPVKSLEFTKRGIYQTIEDKLKEKNNG